MTKMRGRRLSGEMVEFEHHDLGEQRDGRLRSELRGGLELVMTLPVGYGSDRRMHYELCQIAALGLDPMTLQLSDGVEWTFAFASPELSDRMLLEGIRAFHRAGGLPGPGLTPEDVVKRVYFAIVNGGRGA